MGYVTELWWKTLEPDYRQDFTPLPPGTEKRRQETANAGTKEIQLLMKFLRMERTCRSRELHLLANSKEGRKNLLLLYFDKIADGKGKK